MHSLQVLLAQRGDPNSPINKWLTDHPIVTAVGFLAIAVVLIASGLYELKSGTTHDKRGNEVSGLKGKALSIVRIVAGAALGVYAIYGLAT